MIEMIEIKLHIKNVQNHKPWKFNWNWFLGSIYTFYYSYINTKHKNNKLNFDNEYFNITNADKLL
jgi:hypothetical protein